MTARQRPELPYAGMLHATEIIPQELAKHHDLSSLRVVLPIREISADSGRNSRREGFANGLAARPCQMKSQLPNSTSRRSAP